MSAARADLVVIGAGLSGLTAARVAHDGGLSVVVLEAASRMGGRIASLRMPDDTYVADLGPSWVWPPYQPVVAEWIARLGVQTRPQFEQGDAIVDLPGRLQRGFLPGQHGMQRLVGGPESLVRAMAAGLPGDTLHLDSPVERATVRSDRVELGTPRGTFAARFAIVALPPRMVQQSLRFEPALPAALGVRLDSIPTWMASMAKAVAVFERPFWRDAGLSGRIASRVGPLVEAHDMSNDDGRGVLFGFVGVPHPQRIAHPEALRTAIRAQLVRCLGPEAAAAELTVQDWATEPRIASRLDLEREPAHPELTPEVLRHPHEGRIWLAGAETATLSPGLLEGALEAGERTARAVLARA